MLAILLALAWAPLTAHCQIESIAGLELLRCESAAAPSSAGDSHCGDASCCSWESGQCQLPQSQLSVVPQLATAVPAEPVPSLLSSLPAKISGLVLVAVAPGPPRPWQFCLRAALPPRAPSTVS